MNATTRLSVRPVLLLAAFAFSFASCAHVQVHKMQVEAAARPDAERRISYVVRDTSLPAAAPIDSAAAGKFVRTALSAKGLYEAPAADLPDLEVTFNYDVVKRTRERQWEEPVYRNIPGGSHTIFEPGGFDLNDNLTIRTVSVQDPPVKVLVRYFHRTETEVTYEKSLHIVATERKPSSPGAPARVWDISIACEEKTPDMEKIMPLLAAAGCDRIGTNTDGPITVRLRDKDEVVAFINRGL
jgi:hypothetical protein